jgi:hypothetical protein
VGPPNGRVADPGNGRAGLSTDPGVGAYPGRRRTTWVPW